MQFSKKTVVLAGMAMSAALMFAACSKTATTDTGANATPAATDMPSATPDTTMPSATPAVPQDGFMMSPTNGKMMMIKGGVPSVMTATATLSDGTKVTITGKVTTKAGKVTQMKKGDEIFVDGTWAAMASATPAASAMPSPTVKPSATPAAKK